MADADTIHALAELLYSTAVDLTTDHSTAASFRFDISARVKHASFLVPFSKIPEELRARITPSVEKNAAAFLYGFDVICKAADHSARGRCFQIERPPELIGLSWDEVIGRKPNK